jgi:hypothetical protein
VQKPTKALKSVKGPGNAFDWNPKWARTLPTFLIFLWVINSDPTNPNIKVVFQGIFRGEQRGAGHLPQ